MGATNINTQEELNPYSIGPYQSTHCTGGAIMGTDPGNSVTNKYGQVWDTPNVFRDRRGALPAEPGHEPDRHPLVAGLSRRRWPHQGVRQRSWQDHRFGVSTSSPRIIPDSANLPAGQPAGRFFMCRKSCFQCRGRSLEGRPAIPVVVRRTTAFFLKRETQTGQALTRASQRRRSMKNLAGGADATARRDPPLNQWQGGHLVERNGPAGRDA